MVVMGIIVLLMGLLVGVLGGQPAGSARGVATLVMQSLEEARMSAIEGRQPVYFCVAGADDSNEDHRLRAYLLCRKQTAEEEPVPAKQQYVSLTSWEMLPQGFYFDPADLENATAELKAEGLPGKPGKVRVVEYDALGQMQPAQSTGRPKLTITQAVLKPDGSLTYKNGRNADVSIELFRYTGRVRLAQKS